MDEAPQTSECAASVLAFGLYAHVAIMQTTSEVAAYINGTRMGQSVLKTGEVNVLEGEQVIVLEGPTGDTASTSAVISHVAVVPTQSSKEVEELCAVMKEIFVAAPPLKAFGPSGECTGEKCLEKAAEAQSGYRVSRVLLWGGEFFDGLQFVYDKSSATDGASADTVYGALVGNANAKRQASSPSATLELLPDEVITRVSGRKGAWTDCICLVTNFGRSVTCGGKGGGDFSVPTPVDSEIRFITCKAGDHLTDIRAFVLETSSAKAVADNVVSTLKEILSSSESAIRQNAISAALRYLGNIALQPKEPKFQRIRASNKFFASNVGALGADGAKAFMSCEMDVSGLLARGSSPPRSYEAVKVGKCPPPRSRRPRTPIELTEEDMRTLSADEIRKKKNRVSAQRDRDRKKQHVQDVEDMVCELWKRVQYLEGVIMSLHPNEDANGLYRHYQPYAVSRTLEPLTGSASGPDSELNEVDMTELAWLLDSIPMES
ncbi:hypothetical protein PHYBOEH_008276 [Phytophthora boehmeriae]|uniref:Jacalin-type lectin domain-containing protein n=1 Tax=Phytophthora boehmeriae TaxID=109152 RepID=A0A8T1X6G6_9STRA|nr:hypothetical protein PHYBOEH_008276 [Phytophthora boehmeriae]